MIDYDQINWPLLSDQKGALIDTIDRLPPDSIACARLEGILHLVDDLQDDAVDIEGTDSKIVFPNLTEDKDETTT